MSASAIIFLLIIGLAIPALAFSAKRKLDAGMVIPRVPLYVEGVFTQALLLLLSLYVARANGMNLLGGRPMDPASLLLSGSVLVAALAIMAISTQFSQPETLERLFMIVPESYNEKIVWIFVSATAAFGEELTYRGVLFNLLHRLTDHWWVAAVAGAVVFAAAHSIQGWRSAGIIAVFGVVFQIVVKETGSLLLPVLIHFLYDVATGLYLARRRPVAIL